MMGVLTGMGIEHEVSILNIVEEEARVVVFWETAGPRLGSLFVVIDLKRILCDCLCRWSVIHAIDQPRRLRRRDVLPISFSSS